MTNNNIVHVVGTGTIGEPLIGLLADLKNALAIDEVTFSKRMPLLIDRSKVLSLIKRGAKLCVEKDKAEDFRKIGLITSMKKLSQGLQWLLTAHRPA